MGSEKKFKRVSRWKVFLFLLRDCCCCLAVKEMQMGANKDLFFSFFSKDGWGRREKLLSIWGISRNWLAWNGAKKYILEKKAPEMTLPFRDFFRWIVFALWRNGENNVPLLSFLDFPHISPRFLFFFSFKYSNSPRRCLSSSGKRGQVTHKTERGANHLSGKVRNSKLEKLFPTCVKTRDALFPPSISSKFRFRARKPNNIQQRPNKKSKIFSFSLSTINTFLFFSHPSLSLHGLGFGWFWQHWGERRRKKEGWSRTYNRTSTHSGFSPLFSLPYQKKKIEGGGLVYTHTTKHFSLCTTLGQSPLFCFSHILFLLLLPPLIIPRLPWNVCITNGGRGKQKQQLERAKKALNFTPFRFPNTFDFVYQNGPNSVILGGEPQSKAPRFPLIKECKSLNFLSIPLGGGEQEPPASSIPAISLEFAKRNF